MLNLAAHSQHEQNDPVDHQDGPEDGDIEHGEPAAHEADGDGAGGGMPELELRQTSNEGTELFVTLGGETWGTGVAVFQAFILGQGGVEFGGEEGEEEVEEVDSEGVGHYLGIC